MIPSKIKIIKLIKYPNIYYFIIYNNYAIFPISAYGVGSGPDFSTAPVPPILAAWWSS